MKTNNKDKEIKMIVRKRRVTRQNGGYTVMRKSMKVRGRRQSRKAGA